MKIKKTDNELYRLIYQDINSSIRKLVFRITDVAAQYYVTKNRTKAQQKPPTDLDFATKVQLLDKIDGLLVNYIQDASLVAENILTKNK